MNYLRIFFLFTIFLTAAFSIIPNTFADGMVYVNPYDDESRWSLQDEEMQTAFIDYRDGVENMILAIQIKNYTGQTFWIFPVPSKPENIETNILKTLPSFRGLEIGQNTQNTISAGLTASGYTQLVHIPILLVGGVFLLTFDRMGSNDIAVGDVTIHSHSETWGLTTELITAEDSGSLDNYLKSKKIHLSPESESLLDSYINSDYTFVVTWIEDFEKMWIDNDYRFYDTLGVSISFPQDRIYFPLKMTSVYGEKKIPINIYAMNHVMPDIYDSLEDDTKTEYYVRARIENIESTDGQFTGTQYTKISINTESHNFNEDLWFDEKIPLKIRLMELLGSNMVSLIILIALSVISSIISGYFTFRNQNISMSKLGLLGLANLGTITGLAFASYLFEIDREKREDIIKAKNDIFRKCLFIIIAFSSISVFGMSDFFENVDLGFLNLIIKIPIALLSLPTSFLIHTIDDYLFSVGLTLQYFVLSIAFYYLIFFPLLMYKATKTKIPSYLCGFTLTFLLLVFASNFIFGIIL